MKPRTVLLVAAVLAACLVAALYFAQDIRRGEATRSTLETQDAALGKKVENLKGKIVASEEALAATTAALKTASAVKTGANPVGNKNGPVDFPTLLQKSPKFQAAYLNAERARLGTAYGLLFRQLHLTPAQISNFEDALTDHAGRLMDLQATARAQGLTDSDPAVASLRQQADSELQQTERAVVGDEAFPQAQEYARTLPVRDLVNRLAGTVAFTSPLTPEQGEQMTQVLAKASAPYQNGGTADWNQVDWAQVDQAAQSFLTPAQLAAWQQAEPMGGDPSRWMAILQARITAAIHPAGASAGAHP